MGGTTVHGKGYSTLEALADVERQVKETCEKMKLDERAVEYLEYVEAHQDSDGVWHVWQRVRL